jgi:hypothetical protein
MPAPGAFTTARDRAWRLRDAMKAQEPTRPKRQPIGANVNTLNPGRKTDMGENSCVHSVEVTVTRPA